MNLFLLSVCCLLSNILLQHLLHGNVVDVISPLITAVALVSSRKIAFAWTALMGLFWAAFMDLPFLILILIWSLLVWSINSVARDIAWSNKSVGAVLAILVSLSWHVAVLLTGWLSGSSPTFDVFTFGTLLIRPVSSGILFIVFWEFLMYAANPKVIVPGR